MGECPETPENKALTAFWQVFGAAVLRTAVFFWQSFTVLRRSKNPVNLVNPV